MSRYKERIPIYVARSANTPNAAFLEFPLWFLRILLVLSLSNIMLWGGIGLIEVFNYFS